jgi:hypothetical protein
MVNALRCNEFFHLEAMFKDGNTFAVEIILSDRS